MDVNQEGLKKSELKKKKKKKGKEKKQKDSRALLTAAQVSAGSENKEKNVNRKMSVPQEFRHCF